jgi:hypothetical protein
MRGAVTKQRSKKGCHRTLKQEIVLIITVIKNKKILKKPKDCHRTIYL